MKHCTLKVYRWRWWEHEQIRQENDNSDTVWA